jgi:putative endonuclease
MKADHHYYVYIIECKDGSYYTGVTNNLDRRLWEHNSGYNVGCYTYKRRPVILKYCEHFTYILAAIAFEKQLKGWSRKKKEALFKGDWEEISRLAKCSKSKEDQDNPSTSNPSTSPG